MNSSKKLQQVKETLTEAARWRTMPGGPEAWRAGRSGMKTVEKFQKDDRAFLRMLKMVKKSMAEVESRYKDISSVTYPSDRQAEAMERAREHLIQAANSLSLSGSALQSVGTESEGKKPPDIVKRK